jgi:hypothetical protein
MSTYASVWILGLGMLFAASDRLEEHKGLAELPFSQGQSFATLDAYLAHLERLGTIGITWYQRLPNDTYEMVRRRAPGAKTIIFTRQELLERYGFAE